MILPMIGMNWKEYCRYTLHDQTLLENSLMAYSRNNGFVTLPNSNTPILPPGRSTRYASSRTAGREVQFLMPKAMVYRSIESSGICEGRD